MTYNVFSGMLNPTQSINNNNGHTAGQILEAIFVFHHLGTV